MSHFDNDFFKDGEHVDFFKSARRRLWWVLPVWLAIAAGTLAFIAVLVKWVIS